MSSDMHLVWPDWSSNRRDWVEEEKSTKSISERCRRGLGFAPIMMIMMNGLCVW